MDPQYGLCYTAFDVRTILPVCHVRTILPPSCTAPQRLLLEGMGFFPDDEEEEEEGTASGNMAAWDLA